MLSSKSCSLQQPAKNACSPASGQSRKLAAVAPRCYSRSRCNPLATRHHRITPARLVSVRFSDPGQQQQDKMKDAAGSPLQVPRKEGEVDPNAIIIFVLGGPGSGKGTQCAKIVEKYRCKHLSAGDLLRDEVDSGSELGRRCDEMMKDGTLVPQEVTIGLLRNALVGSKDKCFLVDGFPRELDQAHAFEEHIKPCKLVLAFDCPFDVLEKRLEERSKTSDRADDNPETMKKRFDTFQEQSKPVIEQYTAQGRCHNISAEDSPDEIFERVCAVLDPILCDVQ